MLANLLRYLRGLVVVEVDAPIASVPPSRAPLLSRAPTGPVVFLDIDGVLHPRQTGSLSLLPQFEDWLRARPSVEVVISSSWRLSSSEDDLRALFADDLRPRILGATPVLNGELREAEVLAVVRAYRLRAWAALDDGASEFPSTRGHLVATEYTVGITRCALQSLDRVLRIWG